MEQTGHVTKVDAMGLPGAVARPPISAQTRGCEICRALEVGERDYFARAFGHAAHFAATCEAVTDALGFCSRHGAMLMTQDELSAQVARVFGETIRRVTPLLAGDHLQDERFQQIFPSAHTSCPACKSEEHLAARQAGRLVRSIGAARARIGQLGLDSLCLAHMRVLVRELRTDIRPAVLVNYLEALESFATRLGGPVETAVEFESIAAERVGTRRAMPSAAGALASAVRLADDFAAAARSSLACPLCIEIRRARSRWIEHVRLAAKHRQDQWLFFPTCSEHVGAIVDLGNAELTAAVVRHALDTVIHHLQREIEALLLAAEVAEEQTRARDERKSGHFMPPTAWPKPVAPRAMRCPACERAAIAQERATDMLLELLAQKTQREAFARGYGLCMKHFAYVYVVAPKGRIRSLLAEHQSRRLSELEYELELAAGTTAGADERGSTIRSSANSWKAAVRRFSGFLD